MITRMWEAPVRPGLGDELVAWLTGEVWELMAAADGFAGGEVYRSYDGPERLVLVTHWRDEAALEAFAGPGWRDEPVVADGQGEYLARPPHVWHFTPVLTPGAPPP